MPAPGRSSLTKRRTRSSISAISTSVDGSRSSSRVSPLKRLQPPRTVKSRGLQTPPVTPRATRRARTPASNESLSRMSSSHPQLATGIPAKAGPDPDHLVNGGSNNAVRRSSWLERATPPSDGNFSPVERKLVDNVSETSFSLDATCEILPVKPIEPPYARVRSVSLNYVQSALILDFWMQIIEHIGNITKCAACEKVSANPYR